MFRPLDGKKKSVRLPSPASLGLLVLFAVLLSGCSNSGGGGQTGTEPVNTLPAPAASEPSADGPQGPAGVFSAETSLGTVLVSGDGFTLYILTKDLKNTPSCLGDCSQSWPPLLTIGSPEAGEGVDASKLGIATRHDATFQATYFGRPLYLYRGDTAPGDTLGHGLEDVWQVGMASGELLGGASEESEQEEPASPGEEEYDPDRYY